MKKVVLCLVALVLSLFTFTGCDTNEKYLRIHIRANSNLGVDQNIKYKIKDDLVNYLTPLVANCESFDDVICVIETHKGIMTDKCNTILNNDGFDYTANIIIDREFFPTRSYGEYVLEADFYDALIVELGEANGDNWWCVVYPPLCFVDSKAINVSGIRYKSKLYEIINKFFD